MPLQEKPKGHRRWTVTAILLCLCFVVGSVLFLAQMGHQYTDENLLYLKNAVRQHETALIKQVDGDFQTLHGVSVFVAEQDITDLEQLARLMGEVNEGNAFTCMGFATAEGRLELMELGGRRYRNLDVSGEDFFTRALAGEDVISAAIADPFREGESVHYYAVPVERADGQVLGVLCAVNSVSVIQEILDAPLLDGSGYTDLYSNTGAVILASSRASSATPAALDALEGVDGAERADLQTALERGESIHFRYLAGGVAMLAVLEPAGIEDWFVLASVPLQALRQRYLATSAGAVAIIVAACALFLLLLFQQRRMMSRNQAEIERLAYVDPLTGGRNYNKFLLDAEVARRGDGPFAVWYCDLKKFKYYNDALGYQMGDQLLRQMYRLFQEGERPGEVFCRMAADNFVGLRRYRERQELTDWFDQLLHALHQPEESAANLAYIGLCMGFCCLEPKDSGLTVNELIDRANMAQKSVKGEAGSGCAFFTESLRRQNLQESALEAQGKQALRLGQFQPYFQPKFDIQNGNRLAGAEVLCRWIHPERGVIPPCEFIPAFEKSGLIVQLDRYMFRQACQWYRRHLDGGGRPLNLAVNVSRAGLLREDFVDYYAKTKEEFSLPDGQLELEVTESLALGGETLFLQLVQQLHQRGFVCSLDDFGSGYSSLNLLKNLPIDVLKLDILFFHKSVDKSRERIVVRNIIQMARELHIRVIAEGVESMDSVAFLREAGCDTVQGFVFAKPMPLADFERRLQGED